jgi:16S rRNA (guanine527-N7)-methyltransferase
MLDASRETSARLDALAGLLGKWNPRINLVAPSTLADLDARHVADSAQLWPLRPPGARTWADLGSGGGFPGLVVAAMGEVAVTLIESDGRKCAFLREAARAMGLGVTVLDQRAEAAPPQGADVVSARALAPLPALLPLVARHVAPGGTALLMKGRGWAEEVEAARAEWRFDLDARPSVTDPNARILVVTGLARA